MPEIKLKPCPFCGGKAEIDDYSETTPFSEEITYFFVRCSKCGCRAFTSDTMCNLYYEKDYKEIVNKIKQELAKKWNRRTDKNA